MENDSFGVKTGNRCDIVVPVYNAPRQVRACLESLHPFLDKTVDTIVVINDCSDAFTTAYLRSLDFIVLKENTENLGFSGSANKGLLSSSADYVCLMNSDILVTDPDWLNKMIAYADSHPEVGLISPLSNEAVNYSLKMHPGADIHLMADIVNKTTLARYPDAVTVVGFCMLVRKSLIQEIGGFDPVFGKGYCEESDYQYRAIAAGFSCKIADNVFIYHEGEASFSGERSGRYKKNRQIFDQRWGAQYQADIDAFFQTNPLGYLRSDDFMPLLPRQHACYDILFILHAMEAYGGVLVVIDLVNELIRMGISANIVCFDPAPVSIDVSRYFAPLHISREDIPEKIPRAKIYAATDYRTASAVFLAAHHHKAGALYFIQDDERMFQNTDGSLVDASYRLIPNHVYVAQWLKESIGSGAGLEKVISNGIYRDMFYPETPPASGRARLHIAMMTRRDVKRGFYEGITAINRILDTAGDLADQLHFHFFGNREVFAHEIHTSCFTHYGVVSRQAVAAILKKSDIFVDASHFQGFGLTALEAMSSGCAVLLPDKGGTVDFAQHLENALFFTAKDIDHLHEMLYLLVTDTSLRKKLQEQAGNLPEKFSVYHSSREFKAVLENVDQLADVPAPDAIHYLQYQLQQAEARQFEYMKKDMHLAHLQYENSRLRERLHHYMGLVNAQNHSKDAVSDSAQK